jgi:hypothetical protein
MEKEIKKKRFYKNKWFLLGILPLLLLGTVFAVGYVVSNLTLKVDVLEPLTISYTILGDASNWDESASCSGYTGDWTPMVKDSVTLDKVGLYVGEGRKVCFKIHNEAPVEIPFVISNVITNQWGETSGPEYDKCLSAFGLHTLSGDANTGDTTTGVGVVLSKSAEPVSDCLIKIEVLR